MPRSRSLAIRLVAAVILTFGAGAALSGVASAAPVGSPAPGAIVCPLSSAPATLVRPCLPPCPIYAQTATATDGVAAIRFCPPCPIYATGGIRACPPPCPIYDSAAGAPAGVTIWCPPPCPVYATAAASGSLVFCPPPPRCPVAGVPTNDLLIYCPLPID
jgi:hypothetical protein